MADMPNVVITDTRLLVGSDSLDAGDSPDIIPGWPIPGATVTFTPNVDEMTRVSDGVGVQIQEVTGYYRPDGVLVRRVLEDEFGSVVGYGEEGVPLVNLASSEWVAPFKINETSWKVSFQQWGKYSPSGGQIAPGYLGQTRLTRLLGDDLKRGTPVIGIVGPEGPNGPPGPVGPQGFSATGAAEDNIAVAGFVANPGPVRDAVAAALPGVGPEFFGATGGAAIVDTDGLRAALAFARVVSLRPGRTYWLDGGLTLDGQRINGNGAKLRRVNQISTTTTTPLTAGNTSVLTVASTTGFRAGQTITVTNGSQFDPANRVIASVDAGAKTITLTSNVGITATGTSTVWLSFTTLTLKNGSTIEDVNIEGNRSNWQLNRWQITSEVVTLGDHNRIVGGNWYNLPGEAIVLFGNHPIVEGVYAQTMNGNAVHFSDTVHPVVRDCTFIDGNLDINVQHADGGIIWSNAISHPVVTGNYVQNFISGIGSIDSGDNSDITVTDNVLVNNRTYALEFQCPDTNPGRILIVNNRSYGTAPTSISNTSNPGTVFPHRIKVMGNYFEGPVTIIRCDHVDFFDNTVNLGTAITGQCLTVSGNKGALAVQRNRFIGGQFGVVATANPSVSIGSNVCVNQYTGAINMVDDAVGSIVWNTITNDSTAATAYNGITCRNRQVVRLNQVTLAQGRSGIYPQSGAIVKANTVRHGAATYSVRCDGGTTGIVIRDNEMTVEASNAGGGGNVVAGTDLIAA